MTKHEQARMAAARPVLARPASTRRARARLAVVFLAVAMLAGACSEADETGDQVTVDSTATDQETVAEPEPTAADQPDDTDRAGDTDGTDDRGEETVAEPEPTAVDDTVGTDETEADTTAGTGDDSVVAGLAGQPWFLGEIPATASAADPALEPILIGMINQENTPLGSFPEVRAAAEAAVGFINAELGGVDGRPIELRTCITSFNVEQSQACAQDLVQQGVVALVGGVDVTSNGSFPVIEQNELPMVGGIPAGLVEQQSDYAFSFSGGGAGAAAAFMKHASDNGASTVLLAYGEFESFEVAARDYAAAVGESLGLQVELLSFSLFVTDYLPVLTKAQEVGADAIIVLAADSACVPVMTTRTDLEIDAQLYLTGACATEPIIDAVGESILGVLFNAEGPVVEGDPEGDLYTAAIERYSDEPAGGAGTVGFRGMMNLYGILAELGGDGISSQAILDRIRGTVDQPSFWGHPYTCDGMQVPGLPALCAPQQLLFEIPEVGGQPIGVGDWIDTAELFQVVDG